MPPKKKQLKSLVDPTVNYYDIIPKEFKEEKITYPNQKYTNISIPSSMLVLGFSGSGKSNFLLNFIATMSCFDTYTLYAKKLDEPLYKYLIKCWEEAGAEHSAQDNIKDVKPASSYDKTKNNLIIIDDMINEPKKLLTNLNDLFTMGRKNNCTVLYISQSYFETPSLFRKQFNYIVIMKIKNKGDLTRLLKDNSFDKSADELIDIYKSIRASGDNNFLMLDSKTNNPSLAYRKNYNPI